MLGKLFKSKKESEFMLKNEMLEIEKILYRKWRIKRSYKKK